MVMVGVQSTELPPMHLYFVSVNVWFFLKCSILFWFIERNILESRLIFRDLGIVGKKTMAESGLS